MTDTYRVHRAVHMISCLEKSGMNAKPNKHVNYFHQK